MRDEINNQRNLYVVIDYWANGNIEKITEFGYPHISRDGANFVNSKYEIKNQIIYDYDDQQRIVRITGKSNCIDCQVTTSGSMINQEYVYDNNNKIIKAFLFNNMIYRYSYDAQGNLAKQELLDEQTGIIQYYLEMQYSGNGKIDVTKLYMPKIPGTNDFYLENTMKTTYDDKNSIGQFFVFPFTKTNYFNPFNSFVFSANNNITNVTLLESKGRIQAPNVTYLIDYNDKDFPGTIKNKRSDNMEYTMKIDYSNALGKYDLYNYFLNVTDKENFSADLISKRNIIYKPAEVKIDEEIKDPKIEDFLATWSPDKIGNLLGNLTISNVFGDNNLVGISFSDDITFPRVKVTDLTDDGKCSISAETKTSVIKRDIILLKNDRLKVYTTTYEKTKPERVYKFISYFKVYQKLKNTATNIKKPLPTTITGTWWNNDSSTIKYIKRLLITKEKSNPNALYVYAASKSKNFSDYMMKVANPSPKNNGSYDFELSDNNYTIIANMIFENGKIKIIGEAKKKPGLKKSQFIIYLEQQ
ncbi:MAG TPA: hypothetical protein PLP23_17655 [Panacibacter sp.]|nr:hypothetical protein [Panacibacter sp.]